MLLPKPRQEIFAHRLAEGYGVEDAYETAKYRRNRSAAFRLAERVAPRVEEIRAAAAQDAVAALNENDDLAVVIAELRHSDSGALSVELQPTRPALEALTDFFKVPRPTTDGPWPASAAPARPAKAARPAEPPEAVEPPAISQNELRRRIAFLLRRVQRTDAEPPSDEEPGT